MTIAVGDVFRRHSMVVIILALPSDKPHRVTVLSYHPTYDSWVMTPLAVEFEDKRWERVA